MDQIRELIFYRHHFKEFYAGLTVKVQEKVDFVLYLVPHAERIPEKFLKHIEGQKGLYEIRVELGGKIYRVFCCFDNGRLVVLFNGFQKKTQKTPNGEMEQALE